MQQLLHNEQMSTRRQSIAASLSASRPNDPKRQRHLAFEDRSSSVPRASVGRSIASCAFIDR
jgi:hypothetical protein